MAVSEEQKAIVRERQRQRARERAQSKKAARENGVVEPEVLTHDPETGEKLIEVASSPLDHLPVFDRMIIDIATSRLLRERKVFIFTLNDSDRITLRQTLTPSEGEDFPSMKDVFKAILQRDTTGRFSVMWNHPHNVTRVPEMEDADREFATKLDDAAKVLELHPVSYGVFARGGQFEIAANPADEE